MDRVVVEGPTIDPPGTGELTPLVVEPDRVVLGVRTADDARLLVFTAGSVGVEPWVRHDLVELDARHLREGRVLVGRSEDRSGRPYTTTSPWHVSHYERTATPQARRPRQAWLPPSLRT